MKKNNTLNKEVKTDKLTMLLYLLTSLLFTIPSISYLMKFKTVYNFRHVFSFTFVKANSMYDNYINAIIYLGLFFLLFLLYFAILKKVNKIFKTKKSLFCFIAIVGILFSIIIPTTSLDVYSYIGNGWVDSNYHENPYYTSVEDVTNEYGRDEMLGKVARCWRDEPVVYGPVWSLICRILTSLSFGNITAALYIFKIASLLIFIGSAYLIDKITNKKFFTTLFALNPFILFEFLSNVHNDIFLVFFILLAIYFIRKKKNISLAVASIAIATGIKYLSIILLPFLLVYALKEEKLKTKIKKTCFYAVEFIVLLFLFYLVYIRDLQVLSGIFVQQNKYGRSIFLALWYFLNGDAKALSFIKIVTMAIFAICYITIIAKLFFTKRTKNITFRKTIRTYQIFLLVFTFVLITNFNPWYVVWLFPTLFWQKGKLIRLTLYLSLGALVSYSITYATKIDNETVGIPYLILMFLTVGILYTAKEIKKKLTKKRRIKMKLLMHTCCAPCSVYCIDSLKKEGIEPTIYWYNPNIHPYMEYKQRRDCLKEYTKQIEVEAIFEEDYGLDEFCKNVIGDLQNRCSNYCYKVRLEQTAKYAKEHGYDTISTTLLVSPYQKHEVLKEMGEQIAKKYNLTFLYRDFRVGFREGQAKARELGMYMQKYCGCVFSEEDRYSKQIEKDKQKMEG